ncbi:uncharacterized protein EDB93DRAFT_1103168 [Suillus bovinus]|uniref:uncharacterized protein n=1 Tax=Suillus bovinus TaxID=48563 RepID=UPI001B87DD07|nr:uncharacterized protein EDB93DRAFT_1103168 [Suillus bovinus]KAG2151210.1 hypothetical protein EDB93DRAFT_1103168 [Suillus bovinus]
MSYNTNTSAAAATANQALIDLLDRLNELVEEVLHSQSEEDKMRLSRTIAFQLNNAARSHLTVATYIPLRLLSMAAEIHHAQRGTAQLAQVPDWSRVGNNEDICRSHPLYSKTLSPSSTATIPAGSSSAPEPAGPSSAPELAGPSFVPQPAGPSSAPQLAGQSSEPEPAGSSSAPALAQTSAPPIATLPGPSIILKIPGGAMPGPSKHRKHQFSVSPPRLVKRARKIAKSKRILSDTDTDRHGVKGKGKGKARARAPLLDDETQEMMMKDASHDPEVKASLFFSHIPPKPRQNALKKKIPVVDIRTRLMRASNARNKGGDPAEDEPEEDVELIDDKRKPHVDRVKVKEPVCLFHCNAVDVRYEASRNREEEEGEASAADTQQPSPIPEELDADVEMVDGAPTVPSAAPVASADDFPEDHWIKPMDDSILPPAPFDETLDEVWYSPIYPACTQRPPSPVTTLMSISSHQSPHPLSNAQIEAMLAQIQLDMEELHTCDDTIHNDLSSRIDELHANYTEQFGLQKGLVDQLTAQVGGIARYLRDNQRAAASSVITPPAFNPPHIVVPSTPIFPEFSSISALGRAVTNNVFTPDVFLSRACPTGDGSPVTRHGQAPTSGSTSTINLVPIMRESGPSIQPTGVLPVLTDTVPTESMPSTSTIRMLVTGSANVPEDGRSVSAKHAKDSSGDGPK